MIYFVSELFNLIVQLFLIYLLFENELRKSPKQIFFCLVTTCALLLSLLYFKSAGALAIIDAILEFSIIIFLLRGKWFDLLFSFLLIYTLSGLSIQCVSLFVSIACRIPLYSALNDTTHKLITYLLTVLFFSTILFVKKLWKRNFYLSLSNKIILCLTSGIISTVISFLDAYQQDVHSELLQMFAIISILCMFGIIFYIISESARNLEAERKNRQLQHIDHLKSYYAEVQKNNVAMRKIRHDIKNHLSTLNGLLNAKEYVKASLYIQNLDDAVIKKSNTLSDVGNVLVNAILLQKSSEFPDIKICVSGHMQSQSFATDYDLCTIVFNLLDNALEYAADNHISTISFHVDQNSAALFIEVSNLVLQNIDLNNFGKISNKADINHGYGISNINDAIQNYRGTIKYSIKKQILHSSVCLFDSSKK